MRIFVAFPTDEKARKMIEKNVNIIQSGFPLLPVRFVKPEQLHVAVEFFGNLSVDGLSHLKSIIQQEVKDLPSFRFLASKFALYPNRHRPEVLSIELDESPGEYSRIFEKNIRSKLESADLLRDSRPWKPHVTIGRLPRYTKELSDLSMTRLEQFFLEVDKVCIYESDLTEKGPIHKIIETFELKIHG